MAPPTISVGTRAAAAPLRPRRRLWAVALAAVILLCRAGDGPAQTTPATRDSVTIFIERLEQPAAAGDAAGIRSLGLPDNTGVSDFADAVTTPKPSRIVMRERDRRQLGDRGLRLIVEVFHERDIEGRLGTWQLDVMPAADSWNIAAAT